MPSDLLLFVLGDAIGGSLADLFTWPFRGSRRRRGVLSSALKVASGSVEGFSPSWRRATVRVRRGVMIFRGQEITVLRVSEEGEAQGFDEWMQVHPTALIYTVTTPTAELRWAVSARDARWAPRRLRATSENAPD